MKSELTPSGVHVNFASDPSSLYFDTHQKKMMPIANSYFLSYLEIDEQFGITAKIEAEKELHADFLLQGYQRH